MHFLSKDNLFKLLEELKREYDVFVPAKKDNQRFYKKFTTKEDDIVLGEVRAFEPLKAFFSLARQKVADGFKPDSPGLDNRPICIVGAKACDLKGFKVQDFVFKDGDYQDPFYIALREKNLIIATACTCSIETCFCLALGIKPYPESDFDINLCEVSGGYVVEAGSDKGNSLISKFAHLFSQADNEALQERDSKRDKVVKEVENNIKINEIPYQDSYKGVIDKNFGSDIWSDEASTCVECGACNTICPTCHCFLLYDQKDEHKMARLRIWDSCMVKDFATVAGGANPRPKLWMRLRNRFEKKFDYFPQVSDIYACTGCGRCISACPAKIDIRKVLKRLVKA